MARPSAGPAAFLLGAGLILLAGGAGGVGVGILLPDRVLALLPPSVVDAAAVGGAVVALGGMLAMLGVAHLVAAGLVRVGSSSGLVGAVSLGVLMAAVCIGAAVAALVSLAAGTGAAVAMLPVSLALLLAAGAYGWATAAIIRQRERG